MPPLPPAAAAWAADPACTRRLAEPEQRGEAHKLSKHAKKRAKSDRERQIREAEMRRLQGDTAPGSVAEYEQLVLSAPNSSYLWIKYFAFLISLGEMDKARSLAERALATIHYRCASRECSC